MVQKLEKYMENKNILTIDELVIKYAHMLTKDQIKNFIQTQKLKLSTIIKLLNENEN